MQVYILLTSRKTFRDNFKRNYVEFNTFLLNSSMGIFLLNLSGVSRVQWTENFSNVNRYNANHQASEKNTYPTFHTFRM